MTSKEIESIQEIQGTAGFRIIEFLVQQKIKELDSVSDLDIHANEGVATQGLAKQKAVKLLKEFISDLQLNPVNKKDERKTYE